ncbi:MAG: hypothetical protein ACKOGI_05535 [Vulcanococcus sp.]
MRSRLSRDWVGQRQEPTDLPILVMAGHADSQGIAGAGTGGAAVDLHGARPMQQGIRDELYWNLAVARRVVALGLQRGLNIRFYDPPQLMEAPAIEKVFHFARFDVAALGEGLGIAVAPLFCTKVASRLARTYTNRHGLKELVQELCGVELDKGAQSSDWGRVEELSDTQLAYAANDVRYLLPARDRLVQMLMREERLSLAQRSFACIPVIAELDRGRFGAVFEHRS